MYAPLQTTEYVCATLSLCFHQRPHFRIEKASPYHFCEIESRVYM